MRQIVFSSFVILLFACQIKAQVPTVNGAIQVWADFDRERGQLTFNTNNVDFCDYYVRIFFLDVDGFEGITYNQETWAIVGRGKRQIRIYKARAGATRHVYRYNYKIYRGNSAKKPNTNFVYALPVVAGDTLEIGPSIDVFEGNPNKYSIRFSTYFLDKSKLTTNLPFPFNNKYTYFLPFFQISNSGKAQLKSEEIYTCELKDEMQMQEMSKQEKKKFLKMKANEKDYKK